MSNDQPAVPTGNPAKVYCCKTCHEKGLHEPNAFVDAATAWCEQKQHHAFKMKMTECPHAADEQPPQKS